MQQQRCRDMLSSNHVPEQQSKKRLGTSAACSAPACLTNTSDERQQPRSQLDLQADQSRLPPFKRSLEEEQILEELRQALKVLRRNRGQSASTIAAAGLPSNNDMEIDFIPGLVNRILLESRMRTVAATEILVTLILDFVEPYVLQISGERSILSEQMHSIGGGKNGTRNTNDYEYATLYRDRAIAWAVNCIKDLLRPLDTSADIPALDALLSASGPYDGLAHERTVQERLVQTLEDMHPKLAAAAAEGEAGPDEPALTKIVELLEKRRHVSNDKCNDSPSISWSKSPEEWLKQIQTVGGDTEKRKKDSNEAILSFPYLAQMRDFMSNHRDETTSTLVVQTK